MKALFLLALVAATPAQSWTEPARGSATRAALMDAIRPHAAWQLGAPVEFVVDQIRVEGRLAFVMLAPQRPGGRAIDVADTPLMRFNPERAGFMDGVAMQALLEKSGETWVAVHWAIGATDVWFSDPTLCAAYRPVISDYCP